MKKVMMTMAMVTTMATSLPAHAWFFGGKAYTVSDIGSAVTIKLDDLTCDDTRDGARLNRVETKVGLNLATEYIEASCQEIAENGHLQVRIMEVSPIEESCAFYRKDSGDIQILSATLKIGDRELPLQVLNYLSINKKCRARS